MGFFVRQELEVLVGSAGWNEKVGPTTRPRGEALIQERQRDKYTEIDTVGGRGWEMQREREKHNDIRDREMSLGKPDLSCANSREP